jgi:hypothetical protein
MGSADRSALAAAVDKCPDLPGIGEAEEHGHERPNHHQPLGDGNEPRRTAEPAEITDRAILSLRFRNGTRWLERSGGHPVEHRLGLGPLHGRNP